MRRLVIAAVILVSLSPLIAQENYDIRDDGDQVDVIEKYRHKAGKERNEKIKLKKEKIREAAERVKRENPGLAIAFSEHTGGPEIVGVERGRQKLTGKSHEPREQVARGFLQRNADLYGLAPNEVARLRKIADYANPSGNLAWLELKQELNGLPVFRGEIRFAVTPEGEIVQSSGNLVPALEDAPEAKDISVSAAEAVVIAAQSIGVAIQPVMKTANVFDRGPFTQDIEVKLEYFPLDGGIVTLAWSMILWQESAVYYTYVSAEGGELLWRKNIFHTQSQPATYVVYGSDSPAPLSPSNATPGSGIQPPAVPRTSFTVISEHVSNSLGWMKDGTSITSGNNVDAGFDVSLPDGIDDGGRATGTAFRVFDYAYNPAPGNPPPGDVPSLADYRFGEVANMFFWANRYHDRLYELGFTEAARNFQQDNFGRGGLGNDRIIAAAQYFAGTNNAGFAAAPDGGSGRVVMLIFTGGDPDRPSGLDQEVLIHELTHGTSTRLHGNSTGLFGTMSGGMGEGWSDFYARALLSGPEEDVNGIYAKGGWTTFGIVPGYTDNYYYGIRRFPYAVISNVGPNGRPHNPLTFADVDPSQFDLTDGAYPRGPNGSLAPFQVHAIGEIWCSALLEVRARLIQRLGWAVGNQLALQLVTDGMKLDPVSPTMIQGRNAILAANFGSAQASAATEADIWRGFAARGMGLRASATASTSSSVVESFEVPNASVVSVTMLSDNCDGNGLADPGETIVLSVTFTNPYQLNDINDAVVTAGTTTIALAPLAPGQTVTHTFSVPIPPTASCGGRYEVPITVTSSFGTVVRMHPLLLGLLTAQMPVGTFSSGNVNMPILDHQMTEVPIVVSESGIVGNVTVSMRLNHTAVGELLISLVAPDGTVVPLATQRGGTGDNFGIGANDCSGTPTAFNDFAGAAIAGGLAPFGGAFRPETPLSTLRGRQMQGTWKLRVRDVATGNVGVIGCFKLELSRQYGYCCGVPGEPLMFAAGTPALVGECAASTNGAPDPGEIVTMSFPLVNGGSGATTNLVATLIDGGGVTAIGGPQSYGVLIPIRPPVSRPFELAISSAAACGSDVVATFALSDNGVDLGTVSFSIRTGAVVTAVSTFSNPAPIQIPSSGPASPYPSTIDVSGVTGTLSGVALTIRNFSHGNPADLDLLLVGPGGQKFIPLSDFGGNTDAVNLTITLDDAGAPLPFAFTSGTFRPGNSGPTDPFPAPAPPSPYASPTPSGPATFATTFGNSNPNGSWRLFAVDDLAGEAGAIAGGWTLTLRTTTRACATVAAPSITAASASPNTLWPPNNDMRDVYVDYTVDTACATCSLDVTANEPEADFEILDDHRVRLRAARSGTGTGRVYTITITCRNGAGTAVQTVPVLVPHDLGTP